MVSWIASCKTIKRIANADEKKDNRTKRSLATERFVKRKVNKGKQVKKERRVCEPAYQGKCLLGIRGNV